MRWFKRFLLLVLILIVASFIAVAAIINPFGPSPLNKFSRNGNLVLPILTAPVAVHRDEKGMPYIYARNLEDLWIAQGFVAAQDRLFQMELNKLFTSGRMSELAGKKARELDIKIRTLGFRRNAIKHAEILNDKARTFMQKYVDGVNAFIKTRPQSIHLEFKLAGLSPSRWSIVDSLTILYYLGWDSAANIEFEIIAQMLVEKLGPARAAEIFPLNINPDDRLSADNEITESNLHTKHFGVENDKFLLSYLNRGPLKIGSNNWVAGPDLSPEAKPILANDTHQNATILPSPWYPCGLITPDIRAVGVTVPGLGGMPIGRTNHIVFGITNAYSDTQDLYIETVDPNAPSNYLEGEKSIPFELIEEKLKIKDRKAPGGFREEIIKIRLTRRGPVISGIMPGLETDQVISMRWSSFETMAPSFGFERLIECRTVSEIRQVLKDVNQIALNYVFADSHGNIGWQVTGKVPIRNQSQSLVPYVVKNAHDNWTGWIPWEDMPHAVNPPRGWAGTCNHLTISRDYPYHFTTYASPSFRYRRLSELMDAPGKKSAEDHWKFQRDTVNLMAKQIAPIMARALLAHDDTRTMGQILSEWDFRDDPHKTAPAVFQSVYREFALLVYADELGEELAIQLLNNWYFWQERLQKMVLAGTSSWFDNVNTHDSKETRDDLFHQAALKASAYLNTHLGRDSDKWLWGRLHRQEFLSPIRRSGIGRTFLGGGSHSAGGSSETLYRGNYEFSSPYNVTNSASLRMVVDLADPDKILAVLPGGISGRQFDPHTTDQIESYMSGAKMYWWFSDKAIHEHTQHTLNLNPK